MNLILFPLLCLVLASQAQKLCVPAEDQMAICHKDNALGKKADGAMKSCAAQLGMERSLDILDRAKKGKGKKKCSKASKIMKEVEEEYAGAMCMFTAMGWLDNATMITNDDLIMADIATLPEVIQAALNDEAYDECVAKEEANALGVTNKCMKTYSADDQAALAEIIPGVAHVDCFMSLFQAGCSEYVSSKIDQMAGKPDETWKEVVPAYLSSMPEQVAELTWPSKGVAPGDTVLTSEMWERPTVSWEGEKDALYTVMLVDQGVASLEGKQFIHWFVTNVKGSKCSGLDLGIEAMEYTTPWSMAFTANNTLDQFGEAHPYLVLVFKQEGEIQVDETHQGCTPNKIDRIGDKYELAEKYGLELVAATFFVVPYSGLATQYMICEVSRCLGEAWPFPITGVNDLPHCISSQEVVDVTIRGPKMDSLAAYGAIMSLASPDSLMNTIVATKDMGISTGVLRETQAVYGTFNAPPNPEGNLADTLEGQTNVAILTYQSEEGAAALFPTLGDISSVFAVMANDGPLHISFSKAEDQDFDLDGILRTPNEVLWLQLAKVSADNKDKFLELRDKMINKMVNSPYVKRAYKFNEWVEGTADIGIDNSETEMMMYTARSLEDQMAFVSDLMANDMEFLTEFLGTFECIACAALSTELGPEYSPPFDA